MTGFQTAGSASSEGGYMNMEQHEILKPGMLLSENGVLCEKGFSRKMLLDYDKDRIHAGKMRIKEWDYYLIQTDLYALALTIADNGYMGMDSISLIDFENRSEKTVSRISLFPLGKRKLPATSKTGDIHIAAKDREMTFRNDGKQRRLFGHMDGFSGNDALLFDITLRKIPEESMVIATPFSGHPNAFYYNQKINCMSAEGRVLVGNREYIFAPANSYAVLDWGRGVWTYKNTWYWGSSSGEINGNPFGFNIGYGFGDTSAATENMLFYNGKAHKLEHVCFEIPMKNGKEDYLSAWRFTSSDGRFEMDFEPIIDRAARLNALILCSDQHQVFGKYSGKAILDDGTVISVKNQIGFAEKVYNKW